MTLAQAAVLECDVSRLLFRLSAVEAVAGVAILLFGRWQGALTAWVLAALTYFLARRAERREPPSLPG